MNSKIFSILILELGNKTFANHDILGDFGKFYSLYI